MFVAGAIGAGIAAKAPAEQGYVQSIEEWRAARLARLTGESGYLTLVALFWLQEGENTFGRNRSNGLTLDHPYVPDTAGSFVFHDGKVRFVARPGSGVTSDARPVAEIEMLPDVSGHPTILELGSLRFFTIERVGRVGVRVRDSEHPVRREFLGLHYFPIDPQWAVEARFEPYPPGHTIAIVNVLGFEDQFAAPGALVFRKGGRELHLDAVLEEAGAEELFVLFADATSGRETYGAGRFLYVPLPRDGKVLLDFNRSYNPPCAFNDFATCPLPPRQNRLPIRVTAGELKYGAH